jgi:hypothetical protein
MVLIIKNHACFNRQIIIEIDLEMCFFRLFQIVIIVMMVYSFILLAFIKNNEIHSTNVENKTSKVKMSKQISNDKNIERNIVVYRHPHPYTPQ